MALPLETSASSRPLIDATAITDITEHYRDAELSVVLEEITNISTATEWSLLSLPQQICIREAGLRASENPDDMKSKARKTIASWLLAEIVFLCTQGEPSQAVISRYEREHPHLYTFLRTYYPDVLTAFREQQRTHLR